MAFLDKIGLEHLWAQIVNQLNTKEDLDNKTTVISETSTDAQYPSAKAVYDSIANGEIAPKSIPELDSDGVLTFNSDIVVNYDIPLPHVTSADNGKFLCVVNGVWTAQSITNVSEVGA